MSDPDGGGGGGFALDHKHPLEIDSVRFDDEFLTRIEATTDGGERVALAGRMRVVDPHGDDDGDDGGGGS